MRYIIKKDIPVEISPTGKPVKSGVELFMMDSQLGRPALFDEMGRLFFSSTSKMKDDYVKEVEAMETLRVSDTIYIYFKDTAKNYSGISKEVLEKRLTAMAETCHTHVGDKMKTVCVGTFRFDYDDTGFVHRLYWNEKKNIKVNSRTLSNSYIRHGLNSRGCKFVYKNKFNNKNKEE